MKNIRKQPTQTHRMSCLKPCGRYLLGGDVFFLPHVDDNLVYNIRIHAWCKLSRTARTSVPQYFYHGLSFIMILITFGEKVVEIAPMLLTSRLNAIHLLSVLLVEITFEWYISALCTR